MAKQEFATHREAALALLTSGCRLTVKAGTFLGQIAVDPSPLSPKQGDWLEKMLERADLPPLSADAV
ncbi:MAG: hypothetical protein KGQ75_14425 [Sphingomonadales bacterium]|nr:hypothetical protein [Sphingomonadales bacterium]